jgi:hypothetical protein
MRKTRGNNMNNEIFKKLGKINRRHFHRLWLKAKSNDLIDVTGEEKQLVEIMLKHEDQYGEIFENPDLAGEHQFGAASENDPFLHILLHAILETQLENKEPIEAYQFTLSMRNKGCTHHDAIHLVQAIFVHLLYNALEHNISFDPERYIFLLKKYKNRKPHKMPELLKQEFKRVDGDRQEGHMLSLHHEWSSIEKE